MIPACRAGLGGAGIRPHRPVRVRVQLLGASTDRDPTNNSKEGFAGTPSPRGLACAEIILNLEEGSPAPRITWSNAG